MRAEKSIVRLTTNVVKKENEIRELRKEKAYEVDKLKRSYDTRLETLEHELQRLCAEVDRCKDALE